MPPEHAKSGWSTLAYVAMNDLGYCDNYASFYYGIRRFVNVIYLVAIRDPDFSEKKSANRINVSSMRYSGDGTLHKGNTRPCTLGEIEIAIVTLARLHVVLM